jgi:hypothetical protein
MKQGMRQTSTKTLALADKNTMIAILNATELKMKFV